jgi:predicted dienelactone hydrolase
MDPFSAGPHPVHVRTFDAFDEKRDRLFPCEVWAPSTVQPDSPLVLYSHCSGGHRRAASFLCTHLASHGYVVAALDHSEVIAPELQRPESEPAEQKAARIQQWIANRVPDMVFLLGEVGAGADRIGIVGHSFGGWTALATPDVEPRIRSVVAHAPSGIANPRPGVIPATLSFDWGREVPTLMLAAELDAPLPLPDMRELFGRIPQPKQLVVLGRADHGHFADNVEEQHDAVRAMAMPEEYAWMQARMRPYAELCPGEHGRLFTRGLTLAHLDATLRNRTEAQEFLAGDLAQALAAQGVEATTPARS